MKKVKYKAAVDLLRLLEPPLLLRHPSQKVTNNLNLQEGQLVVSPLATGTVKPVLEAVLVKDKKGTFRTDAVC